MGYELEGRLLEVCTCKAICPCWVGDDPDGGHCEGVLAWHMDKGSINGVDVSGCTIACVAYIPGNVLKGGWKAAMYVDDGTSAAQKDALLEVYTGKLGGPVAQLASLIGEVVSVESAPITFTVEGGKGVVRIGDVAEADVEPFVGAHGEPTELSHSVFSTIPGSPAYVGRSHHYRAKNARAGVNVDVRDRNSVQGHFRFVG
jgi:hypothetical protein